MTTIHLCSSRKYIFMGSICVNDATPDCPLPTLAQNTQKHKTAAQILQSAGTHNEYEYVCRVCACACVYNGERTILIPSIDETISLFLYLRL